MHKNKSQPPATCTATVHIIPPCRGRPTLYSTELALEICNRIAEGTPLTKICLSPDIPSYRTVLLWRAEKPEFLQLYKASREDAADTLADRIIELAELVLTGEVEANKARVAIDALRWTASKLKPKTYSEKVAVRHQTDAQIVITDQLPQWMQDQLAQTEA
jgi:hypothetical protein